MKLFHVRELIKLWDQKQWHQVPQDDFHLVIFDDGDQIEATANESQYCLPYWGIFRKYKKTKILKKHHVTDILGEEGSLNTSTHNQLASRIYRSIIEDEGLTLPHQREPILEKCYQTISEAMNHLSIWTSADVPSIDILDFIEITHSPEVTALRNKAIENQDFIKYAYDETIKFIKKNKNYSRNGLAQALRAGAVKENQVNQCVVMRGVPSEVDGVMFPKPITSNYVMGMRTFYSLVTDSRTAAKSHFYSDSALKNSEYMARKFQLFSTVEERIIYEDCGSTKLMTWLVEGPKQDAGGATIYPGDLPYLIGKWYKEDNQGEFKWIRGNETHLIGKRIYLRTILNCQTHDKHGKCYKCVGMLSENISRFANLGHVGSIATNTQASQNILSIKHVNTSSTGARIVVGDYEKKYLNSGGKGDGFYLNSHLKTMQPKLVIQRDEARGLIDLQYIHELDQISLTQISRLNNIMLLFPAKSSEMEVVLNVTQKERTSMLSRAFLAYIKRKNWTTDERGNFVFDLKDWNYTKPVCIMENREDSFADLSAQISTMVQSSQKMIAARLMDEAAPSLLSDLFSLVNSKLKVNILSLEVIVSALMVESTSSYALGHGAPNPVLGISDLLTKYRSLGAALAYEDQNEVLSNPVSYFKGRRPDSPMDVFVTPQEVTQRYPLIRR